MPKDITEVKFNSDGIFPGQLDSEKAADVARKSTSGDVTVFYDGNGVERVVGSKFFNGGLLSTGLSEADSPRLKAVEDALENNINPAPYKVYDGYHSAPNTYDLDNWRTTLLNVSYITYKTAQDFHFVNHNMYSKTYTITSTDYNSTLDAKVEDMVNASLDMYNAKARRIAKLAKAIKNSVLAQMNDTNPFYAMRISEIYDRLVDYFTQVNRIYCVVINLSNTITKLASLLETSAKAAYYIYNNTWTTDKRDAVLKLLGQLLIAMNGAHFDPIGLNSAIKYGTWGLAPSQYGAGRFLLPADITTGIPTDISNFGSLYSSILAEINGYINYFYSGDVAIIQTALASFNGVPSLSAKTPEFPVQVKTDVVEYLAARTQLGFGKVENMANLQIGSAQTSTLNIIGPLYRVGATSLQVTVGNDVNKNVASGIMNFNGAKSVIFNCMRNTLGPTVTSGSDYKLADAVQAYHEYQVDGTLNRSVLRALLKHSPIFNLEDSKYSSGNKLNASYNYSYVGGSKHSQVYQTDFGISLVMNSYGVKACALLHHEGVIVNNTINVMMANTNSIATLNEKGSCLLKAEDITTSGTTVPNVVASMNLLSQVIEEIVPICYATSYQGNYYTGAAASLAQVVVNFTLPINNNYGRVISNVIGGYNVPTMGPVMPSSITADTLVSDIGVTPVDLLYKDQLMLDNTGEWLEVDFNYTRYQYALKYYV